MNSKRKILSILSLALLLIGNISFSQKLAEITDLFNMSLDELMNTEVMTGNLIGISQFKAPISVTTISSEDISATPARNLYDLIEIYVPGAMWQNHHDSPHFGIRGIIVDRNYKYLLLVNGRPMNMKAHNGATSELENWDLSDIDKIEIISGPGQVTYGPGAVAGVINITVKNSVTDEGINAKVQGNPIYNSYGGGISYGINTEDFGLYFYGSIISTKGIKDIKAFRTYPDTRNGYYGEGSLKDALPQDYFRDYNDIPQLKLHFDAKLFENLNLWARYTNSGNSVYGIAEKSRPFLGWDSIYHFSTGEPQDIKQVMDDHFTVALNSIQNLTEKLKFTSMVSWDVENVARIQEYFEGYPFEDIPTEQIRSELADKNSLRNKYYKFSEYEFLTKFLFNYDFNENSKLAFGFDYSVNSWGAGIGDNENDFRLGDKSNIISGINSPVYGDGKNRSVSDSMGYFVGNGWSTNMASIYGEYYNEITPNFSTIISARVDKDTYSEILFSPRIALINELDNSNIIKIILQQSQRMNTADQLLIQNLENTKSDPETLKSVELIYSRLESKELLFNSSIFYNDLEVLSWYNNNRSTLLTGNMKLWGIELSAKYIADYFNIGFNHSFTKQISWELSDEINISGISYADYYNEIGDILLTGIGNNINNWANNSTKFYININLFENSFKLHFNTMIFWDYEGANDGIDMIRNGIAGSEQEELLKSNIDAYLAEGANTSNIHSSISLSYTFDNTFTLSFLMGNIFGNFKRYTYEAGNKFTDQIIRVGFVLEPMYINFKLEFKL